MYLFYIDESGNTGRDLGSVEQPIHLLVAVALTEHGALEAERLLESCAGRHCRGRGGRPDFEFKGSELFSGKGEFRGVEPATRITIFREVLSVLERCGGAVFVRGIHKDRHGRRARKQGYAPDHPHELAFRYLVERIDEWLEEQQPQQDLFESPRSILGLLVTDEQKEVERRIVHGFADWRAGGTGRGYRARDIRFLIDTVHSVPSQDSWLIQLADCVAFLRNRHGKLMREKGPDHREWTTSDRAVASLWEEEVRPHVVNDVTWP